ncbi:uncharacterized protein VNE69_03125 [Vairimorpha necatrix]
MNDINLHIKKRKRSENWETLSPKLTPTTIYTLKEAYTQSNDEYNSCPKRLCENPSLQHEKTNQNKNNENDQTYGTFHKLALEMIQEQTKQWDFDDEKLIFETIKINCEKTTKETTDFISTKNIINGYFYSFTLDLSPQLTKINNLIEKIEINERSKNGLQEQMLFFEHCFACIIKMPPHNVRFRSNSARFIYKYRNIPLRLNILYDYGNIIQKFNHFMQNIDKACNNQLTENEKNPLSKVNDKIKTLHRDLPSLSTNCMIAVSALEKLRLAYK